MNSIVFFLHKLTVTVFREERKTTVKSFILNCKFTRNYKRSKEIMNNYFKSLTLGKESTLKILLIFAFEATVTVTV